MELATSFTKDLPRKLGAEEVTERSSMLARITEEIAEVEAEAKKIASQFGQKIKGLKLRQITLAHAVSHEEEASPVLCSERADLRRFQVVTYRHDTSETVDSRAMTPDEVEEARQTGLFPGGTGGVRVSTEPKKGGPDVAAPPAAAAASANDDADGPAITDPGGVLEGKVPPAEPSKTSRRRNTRGGLKVVDGDPKPNGETAKDEGDETAKDETEEPKGDGDGS